MAFLNIPSIYWDDDSLTNDERVMLSIVHSYQGSCFWSVSKWCEKFRQSKPTILRLIRTLEQRGYLEAIRVNGKSTTYRILDQTSKDSLPVKKIDRTGKESLLVPVKNFDRTGKESLPYIYKYNNNDKESYNNSETTRESDTATADPHLPFSQTIVELEQPTEQEKIELEKPDSSKKPKKAKEETGSLDELNLTPEIRAAADRWMTHKQLIGKPIGFKKLKSEIKKYGAGLPGVVERSISHGWQGLFSSKAETAIAPWLRAAQVTSDLISAFQAVNFQNPKTSEGYQKILSGEPALKDIVNKTKEKERIQTVRAFIARIQGDEFFRVRIEKSIKEQLTVVLTSGQKENV